MIEYKPFAGLNPAYCSFNLVSSYRRKEENKHVTVQEPLAAELTVTTPQNKVGMKTE